MTDSGQEPGLHGIGKMQLLSNAFEVVIAFVQLGSNCRQRSDLRIHGYRAHHIDAGQRTAYFRDCDVDRNRHAIRHLPNVRQAQRLTGRQLTHAQLHVSTTHNRCHLGQWRVQQAVQRASKKRTCLGIGTPPLSGVRDQQHRVRKRPIHGIRQRQSDRVSRKLIETHEKPNTECKAQSMPPSRH